MDTELVPPLVAPRPRAWLVAAARRTVLSTLARTWRDGRLDVRLPDGTRTRLGDPGPPDATITVRDDRAFTRILLRGELGAGEAYVASDWDADDLPTALRLFLRATSARGLETFLTRALALPDRLRRRNDRRTAAHNVHSHYDLGDRFYRLFLDDDLVYSCALWNRHTDLAAAQRAKLDRLCDLAAITPGDRVLELGCGWGALARTAATRGAHVTAITISREQHAACLAHPHPRIDFLLRDYRDTTGLHDAVLSCEMLEAVGAADLPTFFSTVAARLRPNGRAVIQTITMPDDRYATYCRSVDWMQTYVFPGTHIPSLSAIRAALPRSLTLTAAHDIGRDYVPTLAAWRTRFESNLAAIRALGFTETFLRTWRLYLSFSEAAFAERTLSDHQLVLLKGTGSTIRTHENRSGF